MNHFKAAYFDSTTIVMRARGCCARDEGECDEDCRIRQDIVLTAIRNSESHYIVPAAMDPMKKAGVSEAVINAMPARQNASTPFGNSTENSCLDNAIGPTDRSNR